MLNLSRLRAAVPSEWMQAVTEVVDVAPTLDAFGKVAWATLGWRLEGKEIRLEKLTVRIGTAPQLHTKMQPRRAKQLVFQQSALSSVADGGTIAANPAQPQHADIHALLQAMWKIRCGNT